MAVIAGDTRVVQLIPADGWFVKLEKRDDEKVVTKHIAVACWALCENSNGQWIDAVCPFPARVLTIPEDLLSNMYQDSGSWLFVDYLHKSNMVSAY